MKKNTNEVTAIQGNSTSNLVTIDLPTALYDIIMNSGDETDLFKNKLCFLLYLINRGDINASCGTFKSNQYQINIRAHRVLFSTKGELEKLISFLLRYNLIEKYANHQSGKSSSKYKVINTWIHKKGDKLLHFHEDNYTFAKKFIEMNYIVSLKGVNKVGDVRIIQEVSLNKKIECEMVETNNRLQYLEVKVKEQDSKIKEQASEIKELLERIKYLEENQNKAITVELVEETEEYPLEVIEDLVEPEISVEIEESPKPVQVLNATDQLSETEQYIVRLAMEGQGFYKSKNKEKIYEYICKIDTIYSNKAFRTVVDKCIELSLVA